MPKFSKTLLAAATLVLAGAAQAHTLDIGLNNEAVGLDFTTQIPKSELNVGGGLLHHQDDGDVYYGSLFVADNVNKTSGVLAGIGARAYYIDAKLRDASGTAVGLGGFLNWDVPNVPNLSLRTDVYYAPDVLSFDEIQRYLDFSARVQYRIIEQAWIYGGYRHADADPVEGRSQSIDEGGYVGLMVWF